MLSQESCPDGHRTHNFLQLPEIVPGRERIERCRPFTFSDATAFQYINKVQQINKILQISNALVSVNLYWVSQNKIGYKIFDHIKSSQNHLGFKIGSCVILSSHLRTFGLVLQGSFNLQLATDCTMSSSPKLHFGT